MPFREVVAEQRERGRSIAGLADAQHRTHQKELEKGARHARQHRGEAPDAYTQPDDIFARAAIRPDSQGQRRDCIDKKKRGTKQSLFQ